MASTKLLCSLQLRMDRITWLGDQDFLYQSIRNMLNLFFNTTYPWISDQPMALPPCHDVLVAVSGIHVVFDIWLFTLGWYTLVWFLICRLVAQPTLVLRFRKTVIARLTNIKIFLMKCNWKYVICGCIYVEADCDFKGTL